jgi:hypothetical protein
MAEAPSAGWLNSLLTDPSALAAVSWVGLVVTVAGFAVAIYQLARIKTASEAGAAASLQVLNMVKERMNLTEMVAAAGYVDSIRSYVAGGNNDGAIIYIDLLRAKLIYLREIALSDDIDGDEIGRFLVDLALISEQLRRRPAGRDEVRRLLSAFVPIGDMLQRHIARLRFTTETNTLAE